MTQQSVRDIAARRGLESFARRIRDLERTQAKAPRPGAADLWHRPQEINANAGQGGDDTAIFERMKDAGWQSVDLGAYHYNIEGTAEFGFGVNAYGRGGSAKNTSDPATKFTLRDDSAQIICRMGGGKVGGFMVDGNHVATNPLYLGNYVDLADLAHADAGSQGILEDVIVQNATGTGVIGEGAQNALIDALRVYNCGGYGLDLRDAAGGWRFHLPEFTGNATNLHIRDGGNHGFYGGFTERFSDPDGCNILIEGLLFWGVAVYFSGFGCASGGTGGDSASLVKHYATGKVLFDVCGLAATHTEIGFEVQGEAANTGAPTDTQPILIVRDSELLPTDPAGDPAGAYYLDDLAIVSEIGGLHGTSGYLGGTVPRFAPGSSTAGFARINQSREIVSVPDLTDSVFSAQIDGDVAYRIDIKASGKARFEDRVTAVTLQQHVADITLTGDTNVVLDLDAAGVHVIHKAGHRVTDLDTDNGVDGQIFWVGIQQGATVTTDTLPDSTATPYPWLWSGGDTNKPHTSIAMNTVWFQMIVKDGTYVQLGPSGSFDTGASSFPPSGAAGGDLGGDYPNPTVVHVDGGSL